MLGVRGGHVYRPAVSSGKWSLCQLDQKEVLELVMRVLAIHPDQQAHEHKSTEKFTD